MPTATQFPEDDSTEDLLAQVRQGNRQAESALLALLYAELHRVAASFMRRERQNHTLQPTALVNEVYVRLVRQPGMVWQSRTHFLALAAQLMRRILVDYARARRAGKRGGPRHQITLEDGLMVAPGQSIDVIALHEALDRLAAIDPRQSRIVELRFFAGLSLDEVAEVLDVSGRTVKRDWNMARAWLHGELTKRS